jgi:integrase
VTAPPREVKVAPNIYRTAHGWRVYVRRRDPKTGHSKLHPFRFPPEKTLEDLEYFRDLYKLESKQLRRQARTDAAAAAAEVAGTFTKEAEEYLELKTVKAMPSYTDRVRDITRWIGVFGRTPRKAIRTRDIDEQLQQWINEGYAASTVNNRRTALMALWTRLDGRTAANPVRETQVFAEPELEPRGLPYPLVIRILDAIPATRSYSHLKETKVNPVKTRIRLEVMAWTGMRASQLGQLKPEHVNFEERWFVTPRSKKGGKQARYTRPVIRKPLTSDSEAALRRFFACGCVGTFSPSSARRLFTRAVRQVEQDMQAEKQDPTFRLPAGIRPYDLRHSFGTEMLRRTKSLETVAELLDQSSTRMTKRYALGAIADVLKEAAIAFEASATRGGRAIDETPARPKAPRPRRR